MVFAEGERVWVEDRRWHKLEKPRRCRHMGRYHIVCINMASFALMRSNGLWAYCEDHMYGGRINGEIVETQVHRDSPAAKRGYTE